LETGLPDNHGLSAAVLASPLVHEVNGQPHFTDVQYESLAGGVARGQSVLAIAPTSSGKTEVGYYGAASWLERSLAQGGRVVFLTSHKALARQKFAEIVRCFSPIFQLDNSEVVLATGDAVLDANGDVPVNAFTATVLVVTYEKYLNMLAGTGLDASLAQVCCVADEIQIIGDKSRGQNVEILLTLLRENVGQIIGLSAVLEARFARLLSDWLRASLIITHDREVELIYELRNPQNTLTTSTRTQAMPQVGPVQQRRTVEVLAELLAEPSRSHEPIAVFCMTKKEVFDLSERWKSYAQSLGYQSAEVTPVSFRENTGSAEELSQYITRGFAYHTADLNEDERVAVETRLESDSLRVVFATTTLASGLNYSFRTVIIHSWKRWDSRTRDRLPISRNEFHNMAGRAGRLSHVNTAGRAIFFAETPRDMRQGSQYLSWWELDEFAPRIRPDDFTALSLKLLSSNVADDEESLARFLQKTFSAEREMEINQNQPELWRDAVSKSVEVLKLWRFVE
jgi:helicase